MKTEKEYVGGIQKGDAPFLRKLDGDWANLLSHSEQISQETCPKSHTSVLQHHANLISSSYTHSCFHSCGCFQVRLQQLFTTFGTTKTMLIVYSILKQVENALDRSFSRQMSKIFRLEMSAIQLPHNSRLTCSRLHETHQCLLSVYCFSEKMCASPDRKWVAYSKLYQSLEVDSSVLFQQLTSIEYHWHQQELPYQQVLQT